MKFESSLEKYVLIVATLTAFFTVFLSSGVGVVIPSIAVDFGMSNIVQNWITTIFFLAVAVFTYLLFQQVKYLENMVLKSQWSVDLHFLL